MTDPTPEADFARAFAAEVDDVSPAAAGKKWVVARINTGAVDRYATVVDPKGMDRSAYLKNPVVLWEHGKDVVRGRVPVGQAGGSTGWIKARAEHDDVLAKVVFADDEFSRGLWELYRDEVLRGWSVSGTPLKAGPPTRDEISRRAEMKDCKTVFRAWKLNEFSGVAIPGNPECLTEAVSRGVWMPESVLALVDSVLPEPTPKPEPEPVAVERFADDDPTPEPSAPALPPFVVRRRLDEVMRSIDRQAREIARGMTAKIHEDVVDIAKGKV